MTSISMLQDVYVQNYKRLQNFYSALDAETLPLESGVRLTQDDLIRRAIIMELMCQFELSKDAIDEKYHLHFDGDFDDYFAHEHLGLEALSADGLLTLTPNHVQVTSIGRLLIRNIAAVFDGYLSHRAYQGFSNAV